MATIRSTYRLPETVECEKCDGTGEVEILRCSKPNSPWGECCGGCTVFVDCDACGGEGRVERDEEDDPEEDDPPEEDESEASE